MVMTTWDGHLRIDHPVGADTVILTLVTVEPATEARLRAGLIAGFVTADAHGPPALVAVDLRDGQVPADVAALLGPRVSAAVADLRARNRSGQWLQLDLLELDDLAAAWAPYRAITLEPGGEESARSGALGSWASELWTCLGPSSWRDALRSLAPPPDLVFRDGDRPVPPEPRGTWRLPDELATTVGVRPEVEWELRKNERDEVEIEMRVRSTGQLSRAELQVSLDDGSQRWTTFEAAGTGVLRARLIGSDHPVSVRFRSERGSVG